MNLGRLGLRLRHPFERSHVGLHFHGLLLLFGVDAVGEILVDCHFLVDGLGEHLGQVGCLLELGDGYFGLETVEVIGDIGVSSVESEGAVEESRGESAVVDLVHLLLVVCYSIL